MERIRAVAPSADDRRKLKQIVVNRRADGLEFGPRGIFLDPIVASTAQGLLTGVWTHRSTRPIFGLLASR